MAAPHAAVAERFRYFLEASALSREDFVAKVSGAITPRSLFSILSGARQPSRALALLIEKVWGYRADFLLEGEGEMWMGPSRGAAASLSPLEQEMLGFMRRSVDNAREMRRALDNAQLWERLFARTQTLLRGLEACAADPEQRPLYPAFAKLVYEDSRFMASKFEQLVALLHRRRVHRLTTGYLDRYVDELPRGILRKTERAELTEMLSPVSVRREETLRALDESIAALRTTLENFCSLGSPLPMLAARSSVRKAQKRREAIAQLEESLEKKARSKPISDALRALRSLDAETPTMWSEMKRMARDLLAELDAEIAMVPSLSLEELRALHERIVEPLMM